jgi:hypothetical protein
MKKLIWWFTLVVLLSGCYSLGNLDTLRTHNRQNLMKLHIGITKEEALSIMGTEKATDTYYTQAVTATNPYKSEILQGKDKTLEVIYYYTEMKRASFEGLSGMTGIADDELTPLVFDNGKLIGWGWSFLNDNIQKYEIRMR